MSEPISDERLAEIRAWVADANSPAQYVIYKAGDILALLARLDKAEAALLQIVRYEADMDDHNSVASYFSTLASNALPPPPKGS